MHRLSVALVLLAACGPEAPPAPLVNPYGVDAARVCPAFDTSTVTLDAGGLTRTMEVRLPTDPVGAPVVFAWHWLGGNATQTLNWMNLRSLAPAGYIVVAPETSGLQFEWEIFDDSDANPDLALFDETLACLWDTYGTDPDRVYTTGMSAGGLFSTFLSLHRSDDLAAAAPFSGGSTASEYVSPTSLLPVMVTWGGPTDLYGPANFDENSRTYADALEADGHFVVRCEHDLGHTPPDEAADMARIFFDAHVRGADEPWLDGLPETLPSWCQ